MKVAQAKKEFVQQYLPGFKLNMGIKEINNIVPKVKVS